MPGIAPVFGRFGPAKPRLRQVLLAVQRYNVANGCRTQAERNGSNSQENVILTVKNMLMLQTKAAP